MYKANGILTFLYKMAATRANFEIPFFKSIFTDSESKNSCHLQKNKKRNLKLHKTC